MLRGIAWQAQTVVNKGKSNPLIAEALLKILRELISPIPPKPHTNSFHEMVGLQKAVLIFSTK